MSGDSFLSDEVESDENEQEEGTLEVTDVQTVDSSKGTGDLIKPVTEDLGEITRTFEQFEEIKTQLLDQADIQTISGNPFITKSGWRKIATAFNISVETEMEERELQNGVIQWRVKAVAEAPNNVSSSGVGMAASNESNFMELVADGDEQKPEGEDIIKVDGNWRRLRDPRAVDEHNVYATAATRSKNRAISDLVGGGEVSAEELDADHYL